MNCHSNIRGVVDDQQSPVDQVFLNGRALPGVFISGDAHAQIIPGTRQVYVPSQPSARDNFLRAWARRNAQRIAAGLGGLTLVLPMAMAASAQQEALVDLSTIDGVASVEVAQNGELLVKLENGQQFRITSAGFREVGEGSFLVPASTADAIAEAAAEDVAAGSTAGGSGVGLLGGLAALVGGAAAGGGGGGGDTPTAPELAFVVDGYLAGAQVFGDANGNGIFDAGETSTATASDGSFDSSLFAGDVPLVARGGIDISTGEPFTGTLKAPAGSTVVTPLTTVVQALIDSDTSGTPPTPAEAAATVASSLGLSGDLLNDDPAELAESGELSQLQAAAKIAAVVNLVSASAPSDPEGAVDAVLEALAADLTDGAGGDPFDDPTAIEAALSAAGTLIEVSTTELAEALVDAGAQIDGAGSLSDLEGAQTVVQGTLTDAVTQSVGVTDGTSALNDANQDTALYDSVVPLRPVITDFTPTGDPLGNNGSFQVTLSGTARPGSTINVTIGTNVSSTTADANGDWTYTSLPSGYLPVDTEGAVTAIVRATENGITSSAAVDAPTYVVDGVRPPPLTFISIGSQGDAFINAEELSTAEFIGETEPGAIVTLSLNGGPSIDVVADGAGRVTIPLDGGPLGTLQEGVNQINTIVRDGVGNVALSNLNLGFQVDTIAPDAPIGSFDDIVTDGGPGTGFRGSGTATPGGFVTVELRQSGEAPISLGTTSVQSDGTWGFVSTLTTVPDGNYEVVAISVDQAGNRTEGMPEPLLIDRGAPAAPLVFVSPTIGPDDLTGGAYTVFGQAEPGATVLVTVDGVAQPSTVADVNGDWSIRILAEDGADFIQAIARDAGGNESPPAFASTTINVDPPVIGATTVDTLINAAEAVNVALSGTVQGATGVTIEILDGSSAVVVSSSATPDGSGNWSDTLDLSALGDGSYTVRVTATDGTLEASDGTAATFELDQTAPSAPVLTVNGAGVDATINISEEAGATLDGNAEPNSNVTVTVGGAQQVVQTDGSGNFSLSLAGLLGEGATLITATQADTAGNVSTAGQATATADLTAPTAPTIDAITGDDVITAVEAVSTVVVTGSGSDGDVVELFIDGSSQGTSIVSGGAWSIDITTPTEGNYTATVQATDAAGNASAVSVGRDFSVVTTVPTIGIDALGVGTLANAAEIAVPVSVTGTSSDATSVTVAVLQGATQILAPAAATLNGDGTWSVSLDLSGLADGSYTIEALASDGIASVGTSTALDIDATAPGTPTVNAVAGDNVVNIAEASGGSYTLSGAAEDGATVEITFNGTDAVSVVAGPNGWSYERTATEGTDAIEVTATDAAGNTSGTASTSVTIDLTVPSTPSFDVASETYDNTQIGAVTISGTADPGVTVRLSSTLFASDTDVTADGSGNWSVGPLDLSGNADSDYQITALALDAAGNVSAAATASRTIDAVPDGVVQITLQDGEQPGDLVLYDAAEFVLLNDAAESDEGGGNVSNVPAGTEVTVRITGTAASGAFDATYGPFLTDVNGDFAIAIPDADLIALDGMTEAGTATISAGGETFELKLLINSAINDGVSNVFLAGTTAIDPVVDAAAAVTGEVAVELRDGAELSNGLTVVTTDVFGPPDGFDYQTIAIYDGVSSAPLAFFALDGNGGTDIPALSSQFYVRGDDVYVLQIGVSGTLVPSVDIQQSDTELYTMYRIPAASLAAAIPASGTNLDFSASGVTQFSFSLADIDSGYAGGGIPANVAYIPIDISDADGPPVLLLVREDQTTGVTSEGFLVQIDPLGQTVLSQEIDVTPLLDLGGSIDDFNIEQRLTFDQTTGELISAEFGAPDQGDGLTRTVRYDYVSNQLATTAVGADDQADLLLAQGQPTEFLFGGTESGSGLDNDVFLVGNTSGDEGAVNVTVNGNQVTFSVDRDVFLQFFQGATTVPEFSFDVFWTGSVNPTSQTYGTYTIQSSGTTIQAGTTTQGFNFGRFTVDLDVAGFEAAGAGSGPIELVTLEAAGLDTGDFYAWGWRDVEGDADIGLNPPVFDGFIKVDGVDGAGSQVIVLTDSQSTSGFDLVTGFDLSANGDILQIEASLNHYRGTGLERVANDAIGVSIAPDTGIVVFEGLTPGEDLDVIAVAETALSGVQNESIIAVTADDTSIAIWRLDFDGSGNVQTDSFARLDGLTDADLAAFGVDDIRLELPTV